MIPLLKLCASIGLVAIAVLSPLKTKAQVIPDQTLGTERSTIQSLPNNIDRIEGGAVRGTNLFHSFEQFSINRGNTVFFNNASNIENIISRVTGNSISNINGIIRANGTANLFLLNPNGIVFGENARLEIGGAFTATTAERLQFADGTFLTTQPTSSPLLTLSVPIGLQLNSSTGTIQNTGNLTVQPGRSVTLQAQEITISGNDDRITPTRNNIIVQASTLENHLTSGMNVRLTASERITGNRFEINPRNDRPVTFTVQATNDISFSNFGIGNLEIPNTEALNIVLNADSDQSGQGSIRLINEVAGDGFGLRGGGLNATASGTFSLENAGIGSSNSSPTDALPISIQASTISLRKAGIGGITTGVGKGSDLKLVANQITIDQFGLVTFNSEGGSTGGQVGNITIQAIGDASIDSSFINSETRSTGDGGNITLQAFNLEIDSTRISSTTTQGSVGQGGNLILSVANKLVGINSTLGFEHSGDGNAGNLKIQAGDFVFRGNTLDTGGAILNTSTGSVDGTFRSKGNAGNIEILANSIFFENGIGIFSTTGGTGNAGRIQIESRESLILKNRSNINAGAVLNSPGDAGDIDIKAQTILFEHEQSQNLDDVSGVQSFTRGIGRGGNVILRADEITLRSLGVIEQDVQFDVETRQNKAEGIGGSLTGIANVLTLDRQSRIASGTQGKGQGGTVDLRIRDRLFLDNGSSISTAAAPNRQQFILDPEGGRSLQFGAAGDINIQTNSIAIKNGSSISSEALSTDGGDITITLRDQGALLLQGKSSISASAGTAQAGGNGGNLILNAPNGFLIALPRENSDFRANAFQGRGGNVQIIARSIIGTQYRLAPTDLSDITASSQFGTQGTVTIAQLNPDPSRGLMELPDEIVDRTNQIDRFCYVSAGGKRNQFVLTGRGGFPQSPMQPLNYEASLADWITVSAIAQTKLPALSTTADFPPNPATGWNFNQNGEVTLVASTQPSTPPFGCQ
jgi:filamentous hemagglutinin family protein